MHPDPSFGATWLGIRCFFLVSQATGAASWPQFAEARAVLGFGRAKDAWPSGSLGFCCLLGGGKVGSCSFHPKVKNF